jgi:hypothetical protein
MGFFGLWVIGAVIWHALHGTLPNAFTMGAVGVMALAANAASFGLLWAYRGGDANMRSAWICTRNDVLGNRRRRVRHGRRMARYDCRDHNGWPSPKRCGACDPAIFWRTPSAAPSCGRIDRQILQPRLTPRL